MTLSERIGNHPHDPDNIVTRRHHENDELFWEGIRLREALDKAEKELEAYNAKMALLTHLDDLAKETQ